MTRHGTVAPPPSLVRIAVEGDAMVVDVEGILDDAAGRVIADAVRGALFCRWSSVRVDLGNVLGHTEGGVSTLARLSCELDSASRGRVTYCFPTDPSEELVATAGGR